MPEIISFKLSIKSTHFCDIFIQKIKIHHFQGGNLP